MNFFLSVFPRRRFECDERSSFTRSGCTCAHRRHPLRRRVHRVGDNLSKALAKVREELFLPLQF